MMKNSKILITGATGFIGSHLCELCVKKGYKVTAFDRYNSNYSLGNLEKSKYKNDINFVFGDIRDYDSVNKVVKKNDIIFHLAALIGIPYSYVSPLAYIKTNVEGTYNVLESAKNNKIEQLIVTSTSEVYGTAEKVPINESHRLLGQSPYAATKIAADNIALSYYHSFNLPVKIIRPFNAYGPRQSHRALIPTIILQASRSNKVRLGNIKTSRDFTYVKDTCNAFIELAKSKKLFGQPVNIGTNVEIKTSHIANSIISKINPHAKIKISKFRTRPKSSEVFRLVCDSKLFKKNTNWKPKYSFDRGLEETIDWFKKNLKSIPHDIYYI